MVILGNNTVRTLRNQIADLQMQLTVLKRSLGGDRPPAPVRMKIVSVTDDWVVCTFHGALEDEPGEVLVAKQVHMRKTGNETGYTYGAITGDVNQVRTHTASGDEQEVFPPYVVDGELMAGMQIGGTGVTDGDGNPLVWIEITERQWSLDCS